MICERTLIDTHILANTTKSLVLNIKELTNDNLTIDLDAHASLELVAYNDGEKVEALEININLQEDAKLTLYNIVTSKYDSHIKFNISLNGNRSLCDIVNLAQGVDSTIDSTICIFHNAKETTSDLHSYAISKNAKLILNNQATIIKGAKKSRVMQTAKGLTLTKNSAIEADPILYIDENDVFAKHGSSIGSINKEDLFYLMSRGLSTNDATSLVIMGFVKPIIDKINNDSVKNEINENFIKNLK